MRVNLRSEIEYTEEKLFVFGVILFRIPAFGLNTERYEVSFTDTFHAVVFR